MPDNLPPDHHVVRYVGHNSIRRDEDENVVGINAEAFRRKSTEDGLSVTWIEHFDGEWEDQLRAAVSAIGRTRKAGTNSAFAWAQVGQIHHVCSERSHRVRIIHLPEDENRGHSEIRQLPHDDELLLEMLAAEAFAEYRLKSQFP